MENTGNMKINREEMIGKVIASKYSIDDQIAILRQKDTKPEEYEAFFNYAEEVKEKVTAEYEAEAAAAAAAVNDTEA